MEPHRLLDALATKRPEESLTDAWPRLTPAEALAEAERCLGCADAPCVSASPLGVDVPGLARRLRTGNLRGAARTVFSQDVLPVSTSRASPHAALAEGACVLNHSAGTGPVRIGRLQQFVAEWALDQNLVASLLGPKAPPTGKKVALVGAGPASLACAVELTLRGHACTVLEARPLPGGLLTHGVAGFRLNAPSALREIQALLDLGITLKAGVALGTDITAQQLLDGYDAVFLGLGGGGDGPAGSPGEELNGVVGALALMEQLKTATGNPLQHVGHALVVGGGNSATDAARLLKQLGVPEVSLVYRRGPEQMGAYAHERAAAKAEGIRVVFWHQAVAFRGEGRLERVTLARTRVDSGRLGTIPGTETDIPAQLAVLGVGRLGVAELCQGFVGVEVEDNRVVVDRHTGATGHPRVFAGGDVANGGLEVPHAVAEGRRAALAMDRVLMAEAPLPVAEPAPVQEVQDATP